MLSSSHSRRWLPGLPGYRNWKLMLYICRQIERTIRLHEKERSVTAMIPNSIDLHPEDDDDLIGPTLPYKEAELIACLEVKLLSMSGCVEISWHHKTRKDINILTHKVRFLILNYIAMLGASDSIIKRDEAFRGFFKRCDWDRGNEFNLARQAVLYPRHQLLIFPFVYDYEWEVHPGSSQHGKGDLVFTDGTQYLVVEVKWLTTEMGDTPRKRRNRARKEVIEQAMKYTVALSERVSGIVHAGIFTNEGGFQLLHFHNHYPKISSVVRFESGRISPVARIITVYDNATKLDILFIMTGVSGILIVLCIFGKDFLMRLCEGFLTWAFCQFRQR